MWQLLAPVPRDTMSANADPAPTEVKEDLGRCFFGPVDLAYGTSSRVLPHTSPPGPPYERMRGRARGGAQVSPDPGQDSTPKSSPNLWSSIAESIIERNDKLVCHVNYSFKIHTDQPLASPTKRLTGWRTKDAFSNSTNSTSKALISQDGQHHLVQ